MHMPGCITSYYKIDLRMVLKLKRLVGNSIPTTSRVVRMLIPCILETLSIGMAITCGMVTLFHNWLGGSWMHSQRVASPVLVILVRTEIPKSGTCTVLYVT